MSDPQLITNSRLRAYAACPRLHHISYVLGYRPIERSYALDWGSLMHELLEAWWRWYLTGHGGSALEAALAHLATLKCDDIDRIKAKVVIACYDERWADAMVDYEVLAVEQEFNYDSGRGYRLGGKCDGIVRHRPTHRTLLLEHKNTRSPFGPADSYWTKLRMEPQVSQYWRGAISLGYEPNGCLWDVLRRPEIAPYKATPEEEREYCKTGPRKGLLHKRQRDRDEAPQEFEDRLIQMIADNLDDWFARRDVVRLPDELTQFDADTHYTAEKCVADSDEFKHVARNTDSCHRFGRLCEYHPVCSGAGALSDESKYRKTYNGGHEELNNV